MPRPAEESRVRLFDVDECLSCLRDQARIAVRLFETTGNPGLARRQIERKRQVTSKLAGFACLGPDRSDLGSGIRRLTAGQKSIAVHGVQAEERIVLTPRAFYGGEDYDALMRPGNDN